MDLNSSPEPSFPRDLCIIDAANDSVKAGLLLFKRHDDILAFFSGKKGLVFANPLSLGREHVGNKVKVPLVAVRNNNRN